MATPFVLLIRRPQGGTDVGFVSGCGATITSLIDHEINTGSREKSPSLPPYMVTWLVRITNVPWHLALTRSGATSPSPDCLPAVTVSSGCNLTTDRGYRLIGAPMLVCLLPPRFTRTCASDKSQTCLLNENNRQQMNKSIAAWFSLRLLEEWISCVGLGAFYLYPVLVLRTHCP